MNLEQYLTEQASEGDVDSHGQFTLDLSKAADKLAAFALPSPAHYLLKMVQVAHHLRAEKIAVTIERFRTVVRFRAPGGGRITESEEIFKAFSDPLAVEDPVMRDLISALIGTITQENLETLWSYSEGHTGRRVYISRERRFSIKDFTLSQPLDPDDHPFAFTLSVLHPRTWMFWKTARRRAQSAKVLEDNCGYSGARISIDGRELEINPTSRLNRHLATRHVTPEGYHVHRHVPADNVLYRMAGEDQSRFCITRPSLSAYVVREDVMNLWASGTRVNNTLSPDGSSSAAWMLQYLQDDHDVSMRFAPKRVPCTAVLGLNRSNSGKEEPLRLTVIRNGVTVLEKKIEETGREWKPFQGCTLVIQDHELETDLTGFQVIENQAFLDKVLSYVNLVPRAIAYYEHGRKMLTM